MNRRANPVLNFHLNRIKINPRRFLVQAIVLSILVYGAVILIISPNIYQNNSGAVTRALQFAVVGGGMWLTLFVVAYTAEYEKSETADLVRLTTIKPNAIISAYLAAVLIAQRWMILIFTWLMSMLILFEGINANHRIEYPFPTQQPVTLPPDAIMGALLFIGTLLGLAIGLMMITGGIAAAIRTREIYVSSLSTIGLTQSILIGLWFAITKIPFPDSLGPVVLALCCTVAPILFGWLLADSLATDFSPLRRALMRLPILMSILVVLPIVLLFFGEEVDSEFVMTSVVILGNIGLMLILLERAYRLQGTPSGIDYAMLATWDVVFAGGFLFLAINYVRGMTLIWMGLYMLVLIFIGIGIGNFDRAVARMKL